MIFNSKNLRVYLQIYEHKANAKLIRILLSSKITISVHHKGTDPYVKISIAALNYETGV
jgi:hypothetical protein